MARPAKDKSSKDTKVDTISPDTAKKAKPFINRIAAVQAEIDKVKHDANEECSPLYEDIKSIKEEAHNAGIPRREFNALIADQKLEQRRVEIRANLSESQQHNFDQMKLALGDLADTELGRAAAKRSEAAEALH